MQVILLENIKNLGKIGDTVKVKRGYARNYLIKFETTETDNVNFIKEIQNKLTKDIGNPGKDDFYGYGLMDMAKGISNIQAGISGDILNYSVTEPDRLFLGYALSEKNFQLSGLGSVSNIRIQDSTSSINIEAIEIDANTVSVQI